ncbi:hypothetical protein K474DRAFT_1599757 [Panus rudis PR-1116 ss-1]|nr:hypothetical protein K474DRAFT_1599757 [Panus rudis PR-1116 ss-1]
MTIANRKFSFKTIDEAEVSASIPTLHHTSQTHCRVQYLLDQLPPPSLDEDEMAKKLRKRLQDLLTELRTGAEGAVGKQ